MFDLKKTQGIRGATNLAEYHGRTADEIINVVGHVFYTFINSKLNPLPLPQKQTGICFSLQSLNACAPWLTVQIGYFLGDRAVTCRNYTVEKINRTVDMSTRHGHILSYQSHDPEQQKFAGAILLRDTYIVGSISGLSGSKTFPGEDDEAVLAVSFIILGWAKIRFIKNIQAINNNQTIVPLYELATKGL